MSITSGRTNIENIKFSIDRKRLKHVRQQQFTFLHKIGTKKLSFVIQNFTI